MLTSVQALSTFVDYRIYHSDYGRKGSVYHTEYIGTKGRPSDGCRERYNTVGLTIDGGIQMIVNKRALRGTCPYQFASGRCSS